METDKEKPMPQFDNPFETKASGARPIPGVLSNQLAGFVEVWLRMVGINLYQHEHEGLAHVIGAVMRAYPQIGDFVKRGEPPQ
jgi:hypothetical protein